MARRGGDEAEDGLCAGLRFSGKRGGDGIFCGGFAVGAEVEIGEEKCRIGIEFTEAEGEFEGFGGGAGLIQFEEDVCLEDGVGGFGRALADDLVEECGGFLFRIEVLQALGDAGFPLGDARFGYLGETVGLERTGPFLTDEAAVAEQAVGGAFGITEPDGLGEVGEGFCEIAFADVGEGEVAVGAAERGVILEGGGVGFDCLFGFAGFEMKVAEIEGEGGGFLGERR